MLSFIKGKIVSIEGGIAVIENNGIGFEVLVSSNTILSLTAGKEICLHLYMQVREDALTLYGFADTEEKRMFSSLITVSGIGCKLALAVLSGMPVTDIAVSIAAADIAALSKIKGVGKKTAERIVLELKDKIGALPQGSALQKAGEGELFTGRAGEDAFTALTALGLGKTESLNAVNRAVAEGAQTTEEIIALALKSLGK